MPKVPHYNPVDILVALVDGFILVKRGIKRLVLFFYSMLMWVSLMT